MMNLHSLNTKTICLLCLITSIAIMGCKKLVTVGPPINTITTTEVFSTDGTATSAMAGVYSLMINGNSPGSAYSASNTQFSAGLSTSLAGMSSDELYLYTGPNNPALYLYNTNHINALNSGISLPLWTSAYFTIYQANSVIEGIAASTAAALHDNVRNELTAEAKFVRAFSYFYLTNFFGDVPMALTVDFSQTQNLPRMPQQQVYQQIISDLKAAQAALPADYSAGMGQRTIPNKWAATLLLARAYLYTGNYADAATQASAVINNTSLFGLEPDLNNVFSTTSREAIWQLAQTTTDGTLRNATPEGNALIPGISLSTGGADYGLTNQLLAAFEPGDQRRAVWVNSTDNSNGTGVPRGITYYPYKYIIGAPNSNVGQAPQYYMVLRLAEAYLIRAEAEANGAAGGADAAIADLNIIRSRASLPNLTGDVDVKAAVAKEKQTEFFAEWGHRWFDLKRTGKAHNVLSVIPLKQPWAGDYQLLYPIPVTEILADHFLKQNQGY
jgi:hypothetical protein